MRPVWLLALNFAREQRVIIILYFAWLIGFALLFMFLHHPGEKLDDMEALFRQQAAYGVMFSLFTAGSAIHTERKTRRILAVLAKGISRSQYLAGLLLGNALLSAGYFIGLAATNLLLAWRFHYSIGQAFPANMAWILFVLWITAVWAAALALMLASFLHPLAVTSVATLVIGFGFGLGYWAGRQWTLVIPAAYAGRELFSFQFAVRWNPNSIFIPMAVIEGALFFLLASIIFARRDVTVMID